MSVGRCWICHRCAVARTCELCKVLAFGFASMSLVTLLEAVIYQLSKAGLLP